MHESVVYRFVMHRIYAIILCTLSLTMLTAWQIKLNRDSEKPHIGASDRSPQLRVEIKGLMPCWRGLYLPQELRSN